MRESLLKSASPKETAHNSTSGGWGGAHIAGLLRGRLLPISGLLRGRLLPVSGLLRGALLAVAGLLGGTLLAVARLLRAAEGLLRAAEGLGGRRARGGEAAAGGGSHPDAGRRLLPRGWRVPRGRPRTCTHVLTPPSAACRAAEHSARMQSRSVQSTGA